MKTLLTLITAAVLCVCGCSKPAAPVAVTAPASTEARPAPAKITGAFGFTLGQKLDDSVPATVDEDGCGIGLVLDTTNFPPFDMIIVGALVDRTVYDICAMSHGQDWQGEKNAIISALEAKYGSAHAGLPDISPEPSWGDDQRRICLGPHMLMYSDAALSHLHANAVKARKAAALTPSL